METIPTHPAVVHVPLALSVLVPFFAAIFVWAIHKGRLRENAWGWVVTGHLLLTLSAGVAALAGEADARRIQTRVDAGAIEQHEDAGYGFLFAAGLGFGIAIAAGLLKRPKQRSAARIITIVTALITAGLGVTAGRDGAVLVYRHGAAAAWAEIGTTSPD